MTPLDAYHLVLLLLGVSAAVKAAEMAALRRAFAPGGVMDWAVVGPDWLRLSPVAGVAARVYGPRGMQGLAGLAIALAVALAVAPVEAGVLRGLGGAVAMLHVVLYYRQDYGTDGADQLSFVTAVTVVLCFVSGAGEAIQRIGLGFIAAHLLLAFFASGVSKAASPSWRSGNAVRGVLTTYSYGNALTRRLLPQRPGLSKLACWAVIVTESLFPLVVFLDGPWLIAALGAGFAFHVVNAVVMGLNSFVWAFGAAYPAAYVTISALH